MTYKEVLSRITGVQRASIRDRVEPAEAADRSFARRVIVFLEDRRVLYNPYHVEIQHESIHSVLEIRGS